MAENIELIEGFLPLVTEGSILGGNYDTRIPHFPENIGLFALAPSDYTGKKYSRSTKFSNYRIFSPSSEGTYYLKENLNSKKWSLSGNEAGANESLGAYPSFSGLTIGLGIDLGTMDKAAIEKMFAAAGIGEIGKKLSEAAGVRGIEALLITKKHKDTVQLTQQQILNLQNVMWRAKEDATQKILKDGLSSNGKSLFPKGLIDYKKIYEPLSQVLIRCTYGSWKSLLALAQRLKGIENLKGATDTKTWILQCDYFLAAMADYNKNNPPKKGHQAKFTAHGAVTLVEKIKKTLQGGGSVRIAKGPFKVNDIIDPQSDLGAWMTDIYKVAKNTKIDFREDLYRKNIQNQLNDKGFKGKNNKVLTVDGDLGANTIFAIQAFQTANNLPPTGELTPDTLKKLFGNGFGATESTENNPVANEDSTSSTLSTKEQEWLKTYQGALLSSNSIKTSVGKGGKNEALDVIIIKAMLARAGYLSDASLQLQPALLPSATSLMEDAIAKFQKEVCLFSKADARVDPNGKTLAKLNGVSISSDDNIDNSSDNNSDDNSNSSNNNADNNDATLEDNNDNSSTSNTSAGSNDVVLAAGVVQLITEGNIAGGKHDTRIPHYPQNVSYFKKVPKGTGNFVVVKLDTGVFQENAAGDYLKGESFNPNQTVGVALTKGEWVLGTWLSRARIGSSGVTIGQGFDLGAKYATGDAAKAKKRMMDADIPEKDAEALSKVVGIKGVRASIKASELRATGMSFSQESIVKLLVLSVQDYGKKFNFTNIHPAIKDVLVAICYARGNGGATKLGMEAVLNDMRTKTPKQQAAIAATWMEKSGNMAKQAKHTRQIEKTFAAGKNIIIAPSFSLNELMNPENDLANWVGDIKGINFQQSIAVSRAQRYLVDNNYLANSENAVDGLWGSNTEKAVKAFQTSKNIPVTGKLDKITLEQMFGSTSKAKSAARTANPTTEPILAKTEESPKEKEEEEATLFVTPAITDSEFGCFH